MKAIIVPGVTDLNKGDQALVWESYRLIKDTGLFNDIVIVNSGDTEEETNELSKQSLEHGLVMIEKILPHPRRGKHKDTDHIEDSKIETLRLIKNAILDYLSTSFILMFCNYKFIIKTFFPKKIYQSVKEFISADAVFVKGGGFLHAYGEKTAPYIMWYLLFYIRLAKKLKKKVVFLPNSYGPFEGLTVKKQIRSALNELDLIYAREHVSAESLGSLLKRKIPVETDLGFFLPIGDRNKALQVLGKYHLSENDKMVGVTVRPWRFPGKRNSSELYNNYINSIATMMEYLVEKNYKVVICNQSIGPNSHEDDRNAIKDILSKFDHENVIWLNENLTCDLLKAIYSYFYFFVGTRFHSIIFSITSLVPSIAIGYGGNKTNGIMDDLQLDDLMIPIDEVNSTILIQKFEKVVDKYTITKKKILDSKNFILDSRIKLINDIKSLYL